MKAFIFPGQGSQRKGMGAELFAKYPDYVKQADDILGYSIEALCVDDKQQQLNFTAYTQPAIFVVSVLTYLEELESSGQPDSVAGHSIGEYAALFAAQVFEFDTGLRIVKKRAELMSQAEGSSLAAVVGLSKHELQSRIDDSHLFGIEIANINSPRQIVIGSSTAIIKKFASFCDDQAGRVIPLRVSGAFHTSHMREAQTAFREYLNTLTFSAPTIPVLANYTAQPHEHDQIADTLANHLANSVRWTECIEHMLADGIDTFVEVGSKILTPMINDIREHANMDAENISQNNEAEASEQSASKPQLEDISFCTKFGLKKPLIVGGGNADIGVELISSLCREGVLSFLDTEKLSIADVESALSFLSSDTERNTKFGVSMIYKGDDEFEERLVDLCLLYNVRFIELRSYLAPTPSILRYRKEGGVDKNDSPNNHIIIRVSETEMVTTFLSSSVDLAVQDTTSKQGLKNTVNLVDAICVDTQAWHFSNTCELASVDEIVNLCEQQLDASSLGKVFVGLSGLVVTDNPVETAFEKGADFVSISTIFLLAEEAKIDQATKTVLRQAPEGAFKNTFDWTYPSFGSSSFSYVLNERFNDQAKAIQNLYLSDRLNAAALRDLGSEFEQEEHRLLSEEFIDACEGMNKFDLRAAVQNAMQDVLDTHMIMCDAAFPNFSMWLNQKGAQTTISAASLADFIYQ